MSNKNTFLEANTSSNKNEKMHNMMKSVYTQYFVQVILITAQIENRDRHSTLKFQTLYHMFVILKNLSHFSMNKAFFLYNN